MGGAHWNLSRGKEPDVALDVGEKERERRTRPGAKRRRELLPRTGAIQEEERLEVVARPEGVPPLREEPTVLGLSHDDSMTGDANLLGYGARTFHRDRFGDDFEIAEALGGRVLARVRGVRSLEVQILDVGEEGGDAPGDAPILPDQDHRHSRKARAGNLVASTGQMNLVPRGRHREAEMRIRGEKRPPRGGPVASHHPRVARSRKRAQEVGAGRLEGRDPRGRPAEIRRRERFGGGGARPVRRYASSSPTTAARFPRSISTRPL